MKLLITGAGGLFGSKLAQIAQSRGITVYSSDIQNFSTYGEFVELDVSSKEQVDSSFAFCRPDVVVHAATLTDVDKCELNKELAWKINVEGTKNIAEAAKASGSLLVYISTDYVFDGQKGNYNEKDQPNPINYYGLTKLRAEEIVKTQNEYCIVRPSVIYGSTPASGKLNFALWLIDILKKGERAKIVVDQWNTPTLNSNLADMTLELIERRLNGLYHLCGATRISRFEFAMQIADTFNLSNELIDKASSSQFNWAAKRPSDSSLDTTKAQKNLKCKPLQIHQALKQLKLELSVHDEG